MKARKVKRLDPRTPLADNAERIVRVRLEELYSFVPKALDPQCVRALHDMRIAAKRLRYLLELTAFCFDPYAATAAKRMRDLQDLLGEIHDCDVMLPWVLAELERLRALDADQLRRAAAGAADLDPAFAGRIRHRQAYRGLQTVSVFLRGRRDLLFDRFLERWADLERKGFRRRLERAIAARPSRTDTDAGGDGDLGEPLQGQGDALRRSLHEALVHVVHGRESEAPEIDPATDGNPPANTD